MSTDLISALAFKIIINTMLKLMLTLTQMSCMNKALKDCYLLSVSSSVHRCIFSLFPDLLPVAVVTLLFLLGPVPTYVVLTVGCLLVTENF